ncbi:MAG: hypothetical protein AB8B99_17825 [Phormidesmis sp.]
MGIVFEPILTLEVWHDYFLGPLNGSGNSAKQQLPAQYDISQAIALVPTVECQKALKQMRWLFRPQPYGGVILAQVDAASQVSSQASGQASGQKSLKPFVEIDSSTRLTFWMVVRDRNFANYTNLSLKPARDRIYYFSNQFNNQSDDSLYLTQPLELLQAGNAYALGDMVTYQPSASDPDDPALTLEAATFLGEASDPPKTVSANPAAFDTSSASTVEWLASPARQYVCRQDLCLRQAPMRTESLARASPGDTLVLVDVNERESVVYQVPAQHPPNTDLEISFSLDQPPGLYQLFYQRTSATSAQNAGDRTQIGDFVLFDPMRGRQAIAFIELSLNPAPLSLPFRLLSQTQTQAQQLHPKTYQIRFKNRATRWRYHTSQMPEVPLPQGFEASDSKTFVTQYPLGHYRRPPKLLTDGHDRALPVPSPSSLPTVELAANGSRNITAIFSDLYL